MRILIADDDLSNRRFLEKLLSAYGEVVVVDNGMSAVEEVVKGLREQKLFQLVCLDIMMTKLDGYKTLEAIREAEQKYMVADTEKAKALMLSALDEDVQDAIRVCDDYDGYICKPIIIETLNKQMSKLGFSKLA